MAFFPPDLILLIFCILVVDVRMEISLNSNVTCQEDKVGCILHPERIQSLLRAKYGSTLITIHYIVSELAWVILIMFLGIH